MHRSGHRRLARWCAKIHGRKDHCEGFPRRHTGPRWAEISSFDAWLDVMINGRILNIAFERPSSSIACRIVRCWEEEAAFPSLLYIMQFQSPWSFNNGFFSIKTFKPASQPSLCEWIQKTFVTAHWINSNLKALYIRRSPIPRQAPFYRFPFLMNKEKTMPFHVVAW